MIRKLKAFVYALFHPEPIEMVIVRRYMDAQKNFIGELYMNGKMIGMSCDSLPYSAGVNGANTGAHCEMGDFTAPMDVNVIRVGGATPLETAHVRNDMLLRGYCEMHWQIRHGFIEHVMEADCAR